MGSHDPERTVRLRRLAPAAEGRSPAAGEAAPDSFRPRSRPVVAAAGRSLEAGRNRHRDREAGRSRVARAAHKAAGAVAVRSRAIPAAVRTPADPAAARTADRSSVEAVRTPAGRNPAALPDHRDPEGDRNPGAAPEVGRTQAGDRSREVDRSRAVDRPVARSARRRSRRTCQPGSWARRNADKSLEPFFAAARPCGRRRLVNEYRFELHWRHGSGWQSSAGRVVGCPYRAGVWGVPHRNREAPWSGAPTRQHIALWARVSRKRAQSQ